MNIKLSYRMTRISELVRNGSFAADIGTDHAYLPISLVLSGKCERAVASDINDGPVERAKNNIAKYRLSDKISVVKSDGLKALDTMFSSYSELNFASNSFDVPIFKDNDFDRDINNHYDKDHPEIDIIIAGMGGELIRDILIPSSLARLKNVKLILQPMTMQPELRIWLAENGFEITEEALAAENGKIYQIMSAIYTGKTESLSELESIIGYRIKNKSEPDFAEHLKRQLEVRKKMSCGMSLASIDTAQIDLLIAQIVELLRKV